MNEWTLLLMTGETSVCVCVTTWPHPIDRITQHKQTNKQCKTEEEEEEGQAYCLIDTPQTKKTKYRQTYHTHRQLGILGQLKGERIFWDI